MWGLGLSGEEFRFSKFGFEELRSEDQAFRFRAFSSRFPDFDVGRGSRDCLNPGVASLLQSQNLTMESLQVSDLRAAASADIVEWQHAAQQGALAGDGSLSITQGTGSATASTMA